MKWQVRWQEEALADLLELPAHISTALVKKVESYLSQNPRQLGKALTGEFSGLYRYRFGDYRIIYELHDKAVEICIVRVGHRKNIYDA